MDASSIQGALTALKFAIDSVRAISGTRARIEADFKVADILDRLGKVQDTMFELWNALAELQSENLELKTKVQEQTSWQTTAAKYELVNTEGGALVYRSKDPFAHNVCPRCFEEHKLQFLQDKGVMSGHHSCPECGKSYPIDETQRAQSLNSPSGGLKAGWGISLALNLHEMTNGV